MHPDGDLFYAQNWEDPALELSALAVEPTDRVLAICSGGCTALALLGEEPASLDVVDRSGAQLRLFSLKRAAIGALDPDEAVRFLGGAPSVDRLARFEIVARSLGDDERAFWASRLADVEGGVLRAGRVDKLLTKLRWALQTFVHRPEIAEHFLRITDMAAQRRFYDESWNTRGWRAFFGVLDKRLLEIALGRSAYRYAQPRNWGTRLRESAERCMRELPACTNYFLSQLLVGRYLDGACPPYLQPGRVQRIRGARTRVRMARADLESYLRSASDNAFDKIYLSNVDEWLSDSDRARLFAEVARVGRSGATVCFRALMVERPLPPSARAIEIDEECSRSLAATERAFMNAGFTVARVRK